LCRHGSSLSGQASSRAPCFAQHAPLLVRHLVAGDLAMAAKRRKPAQSITASPSKGSAVTSQVAAAAKTNFGKWSVALAFTAVAAVVMGALVAPASLQRLTREVSGASDDAGASSVGGGAADDVGNGHSARARGAHSDRVEAATAVLMRAAARGDLAAAQAAIEAVPDVVNALVCNIAVLCAPSHYGACPALRLLRANMFECSPSQKNGIACCQIWHMAFCVWSTLAS
jgi:hypothetical protein